ncbi:hypothetical protein BHM03_00059750 [Ensete ventricosum]|nr:hypothetical protein BHM03_00059750 [Ensete ventricosum]
MAARRATVGEMGKSSVAEAMGATSRGLRAVTTVERVRLQWDGKQQKGSSDRWLCAAEGWSMAVAGRRGR